MFQLSSRIGRTFAGAAVLALLLTSFQTIIGPASMISKANAEKNYKVTQTAKPAPAGTFAAGSGGDGWGISVYNGKVYNIFHNSSGKLTLDCHNRTDGRPCWNNLDIKLLTGWADVSYQIQNDANTGLNTPNTLLPAYGPGQWIDPATGILYAYTVNKNGSTYTPGIVKVDLSKIDVHASLSGSTVSSVQNYADHASTFVALDSATPNCTNSIGNNCLTPTIQLNRRVFSVDFANVTDTGKLMCFDAALNSACTTNPIALPHATGSTQYKTSEVGTFGDRLLIPVTSDNASAVLDCIDSLTMAPCAGWTAPTDASYKNNGAAFPWLDNAGSTIGVCIPDDAIKCYNMSGALQSTPTNLTTVIDGTKSDSRNGAAVVVGTRVFVPTTGDNKVHCVDWSAANLACTSSGSGVFPFNATTGGASSLYTVGVDSNDPTCIWINSDSGVSSYTFTPAGGSTPITIAGVGQIQSFDAYSGGACGSSGTRMLLSTFVAPGATCVPKSYVSLQLSTPNDPSFLSGFSGYVQFFDASGTELKTAGGSSIDSSTVASDGTVPLPLALTSNPATLAAGVIPMISISLFHLGTAYTSDVAIALTWVSDSNPSCSPSLMTSDTVVVIFNLNGPTSDDLYETLTAGAALSTATLETTTAWNGSSGITAGIPNGIPTWTRAFLGWFTLPSSGSLADSTTVLNSNTTYYAHWAGLDVSTDPASGITSTGADLNGQITYGNPSDAFFCFSTSSFDSTTVQVSPLSCGANTFETLTVVSSPGSYNYSVSGLTAATTYYFMQIGVQSRNVFAGILRSFTTSAASTPAPPAPPAPVLLTPTIIWPNPGSQVGNYSLTPGELNALCSVPGSVMTYSPALGTSMAPGTYTLFVTCYPPAGSGYGTVSASVPFTVTRPVGNITWKAPTPVEGPTRLESEPLNALCSIPGATLTYDPALGSYLSVGTHILHVTCMPPAGSPYLPLEATVQLLVKAKAAPVIKVDPAINPTAQIVKANTSSINWEQSPNATGYFVTLDGARVCTTVALSCTVKKLVGPASDIKIYATKADLTSTYVVPEIIRGDKPQVIGIVYFDTAKYNIRLDQKAEITRVANLLKQLGYTEIVIGGHTDTNAYDNQTLSNNRSIATKNALAKLVAGLNFDLHHAGATEPMASNSTVSGQAKNRRAEIAVW